MPEITDAPIGAILPFRPLPAHARVEDVLADCLPLLDPPSLMSVTDAAERYVRVPVAGDWQPFDREQTPYLVEPADMTQSRRFQGAAFVGPAQSGKTFMLQTVVAHGVMCDPRPTLVAHMTATDRNTWVEQKLDPMIQNSPELRDRLGQGREDSTFGRKRFRGMRVTLGYPTAQMFSSATYGLVCLTDYDRMRQTLGPADRPEGRPFPMARQRVKSFMSRGMVLAESAPNFPALDDDWSGQNGAPHMLPPTEGGIALLYNQGTRARLYWECPDCGGEFEPRIDRLYYDPDLDPGAAGEAAQMPCPHCGSLIDHRHKVELNRNILRGKGGWRHEKSDGSIGAIDDADIRSTDIVSWALNGAAAAFASWREIVTKLEVALQTFEDLDDATDLATVHYNDIGVPHQRPKDEDKAELSEQALKDAAQDLPKGVAPSWTRFVTITADTQGTYFPVQVTAFDAQGNGIVVDRFDLTEPPADAPNAEADEDGNRRRLQPGVYRKDWDVLAGLEDRVIPVDGENYGLKPLACVVDFQGEPGVSDNAEAFLKGRRAIGAGNRWYLYRGEGGFRVPFRVVHERPDRASKGGKARGIKLLRIATDRMKDTVMAKLSRGVVGAANGLYLASWAQETELPAEMLSEERMGKGYVKKKGVRRNETLDLTVLAQAVAEHKGLLKINPDAPPGWALGGLQNSYAVELEASEPDQAQKPTEVPTDRPKRRRGGIKYLGG